MYDDTDTEDDLITCHVHGQQLGGIVCDHLLTGDHLGFCEPDGLRPNEFQAWCSACDAVFFDEGGFTEKFEEFSNLRLVCAVCFKTIKRRNLLRVLH